MYIDAVSPRILIIFIYSYSSENSNVPGIFTFVEQTNIDQMAL